MRRVIFFRFPSGVVKNSTVSLGAIESMPMPACLCTVRRTTRFTTRLPCSLTDSVTVEPLGPSGSVMLERCTARASPGLASSLRCWGGPLEGLRALVFSRAPSLEFRLDLASSTDCCRWGVSFAGARRVPPPLRGLCCLRILPLGAFPLQYNVTSCDIMNACARTSSGGVCSYSSAPSTCAPPRIPLIALNNSPRWRPPSWSFGQVQQMK